MDHTLKKVTSEFGNSNFGKNIKNKSKKITLRFSHSPPTIGKQRRSAKGIILLSILFCFSEKCLHSGV